MGRLASRCRGVVSRALCCAGLGLILLGVGCAPEPDPLAPPEINYGEDTCVACGMIISDARFAAATIVGDESDTEPLVFDDVGDMLTYHAEHPELSVRRWYVHDYESLGWIGGANATFVRADPDDLPTPMMSGIAAFEDGDAARALAREVDGETLSFEAIFELAQRDALPGHDE